NLPTPRYTLHADAVRRLHTRKRYEDTASCVLAAVAVGCHFDKLFQPSGGVRASRAGARARQLRFTTQPDSTMKDSIIRPPPQVTAFDSTGNVVMSFTGTVSVAIGHNGGLASEGHLRDSTQVAAVNGVATFANLSIDQI